MLFVCKCLAYFAVVFSELLLYIKYRRPFLTWSILYCTKMRCTCTYSYMQDNYLRWQFYCMLNISPNIGTCIYLGQYPRIRTAVFLHLHRKDEIAKLFRNKTQLTPKEYKYIAAKLNVSTRTVKNWFFDQLWLERIRERRYHSKHTLCINNF